MKKQKTKGKRIAAAVLGIVLVLALLTGISTVTGNPLVAAMGKSRAARYVADTYGIERAGISAGEKQGAGSFEYAYTVTAADSPDTNFSVQISLFGEITDNYDYCVTRLHNTRTRLGNQMADAALAALSDTPYGAQAQECSVEYGYLSPSGPETFPDIPFKDAFALDMPFDLSAVAVPTLLKLKLVGDGASQEELDRILPDIKTAMEQSNLRFDFYSVIYETPDDLYDASGFVGVYMVEAVPASTI